MLAAAPDSQVQVDGRKLATPGPWSNLGSSDALVWGECRGSGRTPYQVMIDTRKPDYRCSCPSRKVPCKHAIGLLVLWAQGQISETGEVTGFAAEHARRRTSAEPAAAAPAERTEAQMAAAARRTRQRLERIGDGMLELERWLGDQITAGLATLTDRRLELVAARMVDAQAPAVANRLRDLPQQILPGPQREERLLEELSLLHLLAGAWRGRDRLSAELRATLDARVGLTVDKESVLATPGVRDHWVVFGLHDLAGDRINTRRVWIRGQHTGRYALVLIFSPGNSFDTTLYPGLVFVADLHFYPARPALRALIGQSYDEAPRVPPLPPVLTDLAGARAGYAAALAQDPWLDLWPVAVRGRILRAEDAWVLRDHSGAGIELLGEDAELWSLYAHTLGREAGVSGEWSPDGLRPLGVTAIPAEDTEEAAP